MCYRRPARRYNTIQVPGAEKAQTWRCTDNNGRFRLYLRVTLLVETAEHPEEIDIARAREAKERAEEQLRQKQSIQEYYHSRASLARAMTRLKATSGK